MEPIDVGTNSETVLDPAAARTGYGHLWATANQTMASARMRLTMARTSSQLCYLWWSRIAGV